MSKEIFRVKLVFMQIKKMWLFEDNCKIKNEKWGVITTWMEFSSPLNTKFLYTPIYCKLLGLNLYFGTGNVSFPLFIQVITWFYVSFIFEKYTPETQPFYYFAHSLFQKLVIMMNKIFFIFKLFQSKL